MRMCDPFFSGSSAVGQQNILLVSRQYVGNHNKKPWVPSLTRPLRGRVPYDHLNSVILYRDSFPYILPFLGRRFLSIYFTISGAKNIVRYTEHFIV